MNKKTLNRFIAAGNALLGEDFKGDDAALILYAFDGAPGKYGVKGSAAGVGATLALAMAADDDLYRTVVEATLCCVRLNANSENEKQNENKN